MFVMKKITLVLLIIILSVFISAAVALAKGPKRIQGTYAMSASGSCIHSENGYDWGPIAAWGRFINAKDTGVVYAGTTVSSGTWVFKKDGTGTYSYNMYATVTPPIQEPSCPIPGGIRNFTSFHKDAAGNFVDEYTFTYEIDKFGNITIDSDEGETEFEGSISINKKTIILLDVPWEKDGETCPWYKLICTATRTLIRVRK